jgi:hypothetical protein
MQFIGDFSIDSTICDRLVELHRVCGRRGIVRRGRFNRAGKIEVDLEEKDSFDLVLGEVPEDLQEQHGVSSYIRELQRCANQYLEQHPLLKRIGAFKVTESPRLQHYRPGGGYKREHFERTGLATCTRMLVWMTYLNDVTDGGGTRFVYQDLTVDARKGRTLIWPTDFTHTHVGIVSESQHKYIITGWFNFVS